MTLGFTESKSDSNLCFKVEGGRPVMLMLCVDALFSRHGVLGRAPQRSLREISSQAKRVCKRRLTQNSLRGFEG